MKHQTESEESLVAREDHGVKLAKLLPAALREDQWPEVRSLIKQLLNESPHGLVLDCRQLPAGSSELVAPLLYELLMAGRQRQPRIDISAVGEPEQTIGDGSAFLLPPRFETIEAAAASVQRRGGPTAAGPVKFAGRSVSEKALITGDYRPGFFQTAAGQILLALIVLTTTSGLIAYSARASFGKAQLPRRVSLPDQEVRVAVRGKVQFLEGKQLNPDADALLLVWPQMRRGSKISLAAPLLQAAGESPRFESLIIVPVNSAGSYSLDARQLPLPASLYCMLAISKHTQRATLPDTDDLKRLAEHFESPEQLLHDRQYLLRSIFLDAHVTKDIDFVLPHGQLPRASPPEPGVQALLSGPEAAPRESQEVSPIKERAGDEPK